MKANLKGLTGIKGLALRHGEKILIAIVGAAALWFVYSSLKLPRLGNDLQAGELQKLIVTTNAAITNSTWPEEGSEAISEVRKAPPITKNAKVTIDPTKYPYRGINPPVVSQTALRGDPEVRTAIGLKAYGNSGILAFRDENTAAEQERLMQLKEAEKAREAEREAAERAEGPQGELGGPGGRRGGPEDAMANQVFDPENPDRRPIQGTGTPRGVMLQGGERLERVSWATVVAKVPIRQQLELFQDAFRNARGYDAARDFPQYVGYQVQRREMAAGQPTEWKIVYVYDGQAKHMSPPKPAGKAVNAETVAELSRLAAEEWASAALEPVDARWTDMVLTLPLPPLVGRNFGADATHPDIPLAIDAPPPEDPLTIEKDQDEPPAEGEVEDDGTFTAGAAGQPQQPGGQFPSGMRGPMTMPGGEFGGPGSRGMGMRMPGIGMGMGGPGGEFGRGGPEGGMGMGSLGGGIATGQRTVLPREVDFLLLRYFDYTVQPGKEYQYRVRVFLVDPNNSFPLNSGVLDSAVVDRRLKEQKEATARKQPVPYFRAAEWSEPSAVVGIPSGGLVHVAETKLPSGKLANDEPLIKMIAETFDIEPADGSAIHVVHETELRRGAVVNLKGKMKYLGPNDMWIDTKDDYALNTDVTLLDMEGGDDLGKKKTAPSRVLLMDAAGQLFVRDEQKDAAQVKYLRYLLDEKRDKNANEMPGGEFGPGPGMRGGRTPR